MNFRIILHLLKTDWQRFKWPVIGLWAVLFLTVLPWYMHDPGPLPISIYGDSGGAPDLIMAERTEFFRRSDFLSIYLVGDLVGLMMVYGLAAAIGMGGGMRRLTLPVRSREKISAAVLALVLWIALPQAIAIGIHLMFKDFSPQVAITGALTHGISALLICGAVALFAAWCPSLVYCLAGLAGVMAAGALWELRFGGIQVKTLIFPMLKWGCPTGWTAMVFSCIVIALLGLGFPWARSRRRPLTRIMGAVILTMVAGYFSPYSLRPPWVSQPIKREIDVSRIRPVIRHAWRYADASWERVFFLADRQVVGVSADIQTEFCPPGYTVEWNAAEEGIISQAGKTSGIQVPRSRLLSQMSAEEAGGNFTPVMDQPSSYRAAVAALHGNRVMPAVVQEQTNDYEHLGEFRLTSPLLSEEPTVVSTKLNGTVYRYEPLLDVPLGNGTVRSKTGDVNWRVWSQRPSPKEYFVNIEESHPVLSLSSDPELQRWEISPLNRCLFFISLRENGLTLKLKPAYYGDGPLLSSVGWHRRVLELDRNSEFNLKADMNFEGARLIVLKPLVVGHLQGVSVQAPVSDGSWDRRFEDFSLSCNQRVNRQVYVEKMLHQRPDPRTCSQEEFARWLPTPASLYDKSAMLDLTCYARRFTGMMVKVADKQVIQEAILRGTPESQRHLVIDRIASGYWPGNLVEVAKVRGWTDEAREPILRRFQEGELASSGAVMQLEEPATYPALISQLLAKPDLGTFESLRLLPGIQPALNDSIIRTARSADLVVLKENMGQNSGYTPYGPFFLAAKIGDAKSLDGMLAIAGLATRAEDYHTIDELLRIIDISKLAAKSYEVSKVAGNFLQGKTAADFQYDPLARIWLLR